MVEGSGPRQHSRTGGGWNGDTSQQVVAMMGYTDIFISSLLVAMWYSSQNGQNSSRASTVAYGGSKLYRSPGAVEFWATFTQHRGQ